MVVGRVFCRLWVCCWHGRMAVAASIFHGIISTFRAFQDVPHFSSLKNSPIPPFFYNFNAVAFEAGQAELSAYLAFRWLYPCFYGFHQGQRNICRQLKSPYKAFIFREILQKRIKVSVFEEYFLADKIIQVLCFLAKPLCNMLNDFLCLLHLLYLVYLCPFLRLCSPSQGQVNVSPLKINPENLADYNLAFLDIVPYIPNPSGRYFRNMDHSGLAVFIQICKYRMVLNTGNSAKDKFVLLRVTLLLVQHLLKDLQNSGVNRSLASCWPGQNLATDQAFYFH